MRVFICCFLLENTIVSSLLYSSSSSSSMVNCPLQQRLPCFVVFGVINFRFYNLTQQYSPTTLVFRTTNINTNITTNHPVSKRKKMDDEIRFKVWDITDIHPDTDYELSLIDVASQLYSESETVLWRYDQVFRVHRDLFYCYYHKKSHENPFNPRTRVFHINSNRTSLGVQWIINHWDEEYNFIEYHEVSAVHQGQEVFRRKQEMSTTCKNKVCKSSPVTGLQPCQKYTLCVHTKFKLSTCVAQKCIDVITPACRHPRPRTNYTVAGFAGGVFLLAVIMGIVVCWRLKRIIPGAGKSRDMELEFDEFIQPRNCTYQEIPYGVGQSNLYSQIIAL